MNSVNPHVCGHPRNTLKRLRRVSRADPNRRYLCTVCETQWKCTDVTLLGRDKLAIQRNGATVDVVAKSKR